MYEIVKELMKIYLKKCLSSLGDSNVFVQALPQKFDLRFLLDALGGRNRLSKYL